MTIRTALVACAVALAILAATPAAYAGDPYGGFGPSPSEPATQDAGADSDQVAPAPDDSASLPWLQQQSQNQPDISGGAWDHQGTVDDGSDIDDASGH